jgi:transcriptional regulator with XRE-family HTH domain
MSSYPNRIREIRKSQHKSVVEVAQYLRISPQFFYNLETGKRTLTSDVASKLAGYFNVSVDYLLGRQNDDKNNNMRNESFPEWATKEDIADFRKMLEDEQPVLFDGIPIEGEKRQRVIDILSGLFWEEKLEQDKKNKD